MQKFINELIDDYRGGIYDRTPGKATKDLFSGRKFRIKNTKELVQEFWN